MADNTIHPVIAAIVEEEFESFFLIAGPCAVESRKVCMTVATECKRIADSLGIPYIFKSCLLYTSPSPRDKRQSRMPSSA